MTAEPSSFARHLGNTPFVISESDGSRYVRAFVAMVNAVGDTEELDADSVFEAAKDAIAYVADDAFQAGFKSCHDNLLEPLRGSTISRADAVTAMAAYGVGCQQFIVSKFEESPGVPNSLSVAIDEVELPQPILRVQQ
jgi:hypothetical protein